MIAPIFGELMYLYVIGCFDIKSGFPGLDYSKCHEFHKLRGNLHV